MQGLRKVYVIPTTSNMRIIEKLKSMPPLNEVNFTFLDCKLGGAIIMGKAHEDILRITENPAILIWGDGFQHELSYYFDIRKKNGEKTVKRCLDLHVDAVPHGSYSREDKPTYANHATYSKIEHNYDSIEFSYPKHEEDAASVVSPASPFEPRNFVHLTIDADCIEGFLVHTPWIPETGFSIEVVAQSVMNAKRTAGLLRLDFGGLVGDIPDFEYLPHPRPLDRDTIATFSCHVEKPHLGVSIAKEVIRNICSYALECYYKILKAAMFD